MRGSTVVASPHIAIVASLLLYPVAAAAAQDVPAPRQEAEVSGYRVLAIAAGAIAGVIVANIVTSGMFTPMLMAATSGSPEMAGIFVEPAIVGGAGGAGSAAPAAAAVEPAFVAGAGGVSTAAAIGEPAVAAGASADPAIEPVLAAGLPGAESGAGAAATPGVTPDATHHMATVVAYGHHIVQGIDRAAGAVVGGYVGNVLYGK
jgi:hypothetical protein